MRKRITIEISDTDRQRLVAIVTDRNSPQKHVWRAQIVLLTADGCGTMELTRRTGTSKTSVWRWQERFLAEGVPGLLRDKTRPARIPPLGGEVEARVVAATQTMAPGETTHWTSVAMARHIGISVSSVQRIWRKHGLQPHKIRQFKLSNDPRFAAKLLDIVGLYINPPEHAVVLSIDEKCQIRPVRLSGTENRHKAIQKSHAEVGFLSGLRPPSNTVSGSEKSYRPRKLRWRQISGERWAMSSLWTSMPSCRTWRMASCM